MCLNITLGRRRSKTPMQSMNVDHKSIETVFSIAICRHIGDKWQSETLFISIFDPRSSIVDSVSDCRLSGVNMCTLKMYLYVPLQKPVHEIQKLAQFLNKDLSESIIKDIVEKCSFNNLKRYEETMKEDTQVFESRLSEEQLERRRKHAPATMYRKGGY